jgi:hypothetical protein
LRRIPENEEEVEFCAWVTLEMNSPTASANVGLKIYRCHFDAPNN